MKAICRFVWIYLFGTQCRMNFEKKSNWITKSWYDFKK